MTTHSHFSELGLAEPIQRALIARNHILPTLIQAQVIPTFLTGRDMLGIAQTGTGKTAAFVLPILHLLTQKRDSLPHRAPRALILAPTRELASQISEEFREYSKYLHLRQTVLFGGVSYKSQINALSHGVDILIATPGRLLDLMNQRQIKLDAIQNFVIDEADRMFDMGFVKDVRKIVSALPKTRQTLLFSATMAKEIESLSGEILSDPLRVEVAPQATPVERIKQSLYHVNTGAKGSLLTSLFKDPALSRVVVFVRTKRRSNHITEQLIKSGIVAEAIHGNKSQGARQRALKRFRTGDARVLVATDVVARGIDVANVSHVINYELPNEPESYIHRIGRTARAGADGVAFSFCDPTERAYLRDIERLLGQKLTVIGEEPDMTTLAEGDKPKKLHGSFRHKRGRPSPNHRSQKPPTAHRRRKRAA